MKLSVILTIIIVFLTTTAQSMTFGYHDSAQTLKQKIKPDLEVKLSRNIYESFSKCQKLRVKLMIKHRHKPRLLRRLANLTLEC